jgi:hypothetical protein
MVGLAPNELLGSLLLVIDEQLLAFSALADLFLFILLTDEDEKRLVKPGLQCDELERSVSRRERR